MPRYLIAFTVIFSISITTSLSQSNSAVINGTVSDSDRIPLSHCLVSVLKNDSSIVKSVYTNAKGVFQLSKLNRESYLLSTTKAGFEPSMMRIDLRVKAEANLNLLLETKQNVLKEIAVNASRGLFEYRADKTIVSVRNSILAEGSNAAEVLEKIPGIDYSDGQVSLKGRQNATVMIDGKPTNLTAADLALKLQSLPAKLIDKVELIENPSSKYEAEGSGGIINIITRKTSKSGLNGNYSSGFTAGVFNKYLNSINLNYRLHKINAFGDYTYQHNRMLMKSDFVRTDMLKVLGADNRRESVVDNHSFTAGFDFFINKRKTISAVVKGLNESRDGVFSSNTLLRSLIGQLDSSSVLLTKEGKDLRNIGVNLNYKVIFKSGSELSIDADRSYYKGLGFGHMFTEFQYSSGKTREPVYCFQCYASQGAYTFA